MPKLFIKVSADDRLEEFPARFIASEVGKSDVWSFGERSAV